MVIGDSGATIGSNANQGAAYVFRLPTSYVDLTVQAAASAPSVVAGSGPCNLVYTVTVTNNGPSDASGVALLNTMSLGWGVTVASVAGSAGTSFSGVSGTGTWTVARLPKGASATLTLTLTVSAAAAVGVVRSAIRSR